LLNDRTRDFIVEKYIFIATVYDNNIQRFVSTVVNISKSHQNDLSFNCIFYFHFKKVPIFFLTHALHDFLIVFRNLCLSNPLYI